MTPSKALDFWESEQGKLLHQEINFLLDEICSIRDHKEATTKIRGKADFVEGRVQNLKLHLNTILK